MTTENEQPREGDIPQVMRRRSFWKELPFLILVAIVVTIVVRTFAIQVFYIPSGSMEQTLLLNDRVIVNKLAYSFSDIERGEIIVFHPPQLWTDKLAISQEAKTDYIKRVIAVGGDTVMCCDKQGRVTVNGYPLNETYIYQDSPLPDRQFGPIKVPAERLFVMGDHRSDSADSRKNLESDYGTIAVSSVVGRAFVLFWPLGRFELLSVPETFSHVPSNN